MSEDGPTTRPDRPKGERPIPETRVSDTHVADVPPRVSAILRSLLRPATGRLVHVERLATGGMGTIEVVLDEGLSRKLAMKVAHPELLTDERNLRLFLREARVTARLDHPNIVPVHEVGRDGDGRIFFTMKLVEGRTLAARIGELPAGPPARAALAELLEVLLKVADALAFAHSRGVIHCDVKPENVMVGDHGQVYLMDWGIARVLSDEDDLAAAPAPGAAADGHAPTDPRIMGTPMYMPPEQALGNRAELDERTDVFALGATLYQLLTGRAPFAAPNYVESLLRAQRSEVAPAGEVAGWAIPAALERIAMRALATYPEDRYPSVAAMREELVRFVRGEIDLPRALFHAGATIVREGDDGDAAYLVLSGSCEVVAGGDGRPSRVAVLGPGEVLGEAALARRPHAASVVAIARTEVMVITRDALESELGGQKPWVRALLRSLAHRVTR